jgi:hypothetical protein
MKRTPSLTNLSYDDSNKENFITADSCIINIITPPKIYKENDLQPRYGLAYNQTRNWSKFIPFSFDIEPLRYLHIGSIFDPAIFSFIQYYGRHPDSNNHILDNHIDYNKDYGVVTKLFALCDKSPKIHIHQSFSCEKFDQLKRKYFDIIFIGESLDKSQLYSYFETCHQKLNRGGYFIFENYLSNFYEDKRRCIDTLLSFYKNDLRYLGNDEDNIFIVKI